MLSLHSVSKACGRNENHLNYVILLVFGANFFDWPESCVGLMDDKVYNF